MIAFPKKPRFLKRSPPNQTTTQAVSIGVIMTHNTIDTASAIRDHDESKLPPGRAVVANAAAMFGKNLIS